MLSFWLRDDQFERIEAMLPGKRSDPGRSATDNRLFVEAVLWIARTGSPWRDLLNSDSGTATTNDSPVGHGWGYGIVSSRISRETPILKKSLSIASLCAPISMRRALQKKQRPSSRTIPRRAEYQDTCLGRGTRVPGKVSPDRW